MLQVIIFPVPIPVPAFVLGIFWVWNDLSGSVRVRPTRLFQIGVSF